MDLIWLLLVWTIIGLLGALRKPRGPLQPHLRSRDLRERKDVGESPKPKQAVRPAVDQVEGKETEPLWGVRERSGRPGFMPRIDRRGLLNGIVMKEVLGKPRGLRPWQPWGQRQN